MSYIYITDQDLHNLQKIFTSQYPMVVGLQSHPLLYQNPNHYQVKEEAIEINRINKIQFCT